jgi:hypothetical protein
MHAVPSFVPLFCLFSVKIKPSLEIIPSHLVIYGEGHIVMIDNYADSRQQKKLSNTSQRLSGSHLGAQLF